MHRGEVLTNMSDRNRDEYEASGNIVGGGGRLNSD